MIDYHVHTSLCNHANGAMDQYIQNAVAAGLKEICFLDHLTLHKNGRAQSMSPDDVPFYFHAARQLAYEYKHQILVKVGLEVDFDPENADQAQEIIRPFDFDVIGGSVHFIGDVNIVSSKDASVREKQSIDEICEQYLERLDQMISLDFADIVCHLDVVKKFGRRPSAVFEKKFDDILSKISYSNLTVELNTSGYSQAAKEFYPGAALLKKCHDRNIPVTIGSDAHSPDQVGRHYDKAMNLLLTTGYRHVSAFSRRTRYDIEISPSGPELLKQNHGGNT
ncbi:MAG: histidinol-phosphatase HisJ family protein [Desulfobacteraceae bacterium]|nr:MAG: histidinol-phosphatase HisJ family protein [Desulfobacteraceae bacterium]